MSKDPHRAPSRLAGSRIVRDRRSEYADNSRYISDDDFAEEQMHGLPPDEEPPITAPVIVPPSNNDHSNNGNNSYSAPSKRQPPETGAEPSRRAVANELSSQERYQLLMHAIQLYDEWKLATIRSQGKRLVAYLVPRYMHLDLQTAIDKRQVLMITIDSHGNTDIREPKKRGVFRSLAAWLQGD